MEESLEEARRNEIAYQVLQVYVRKDTSFEDIGKLKRKVGNLLKEPEIKGITKEELTTFGLRIYGEILEREFSRAKI